MSWLDFANHFMSNQRLHAWSWINRTFLGMVFLVGKFGSECFGLFLFCFCLVWGEKVTSAQDFGWQSKEGRGPLQVVVSFLFLFACDNFVLFRYCQVRRPFRIILSFSSDLWLGIFFFFSLFSSDLWPGIFSFFGFLPIFDWELLFGFLPRARTGILIPGQGSWWVGILAQSL